MPVTTFHYNDCSLDQLGAVLDRDGCAVIRGVLEPGQLAVLQDELDDAFDRVPTCQGNFFGFATKRISSVLAVSGVARNMTINETILQAMDQFLGKNCEQYQLNLTQGIRIYPGSRPRSFIPTISCSPSSCRPSAIRR